MHSNTIAAGGDRHVEMQYSEADGDAVVRAAGADDGDTVGTVARRRPSAGLALVAAIGLPLVLTSCADGSTRPEGTTVRASEAEKSIVDLVERSSEAIGGEWQVSLGPSAEPCGEGVEDRVRFVYVLERDGSPESADQDITTVKQLWEQDGIEVFDTETGGDRPLLGVRGKGGPTTSIGFNAYPARSSLTGVSECAAGRADVPDRS
ncbi:hypothetical protein [Curtobacterium sp. TXMA1]|uniref:hypothetical protein n=1 Tax=Curtobacterium sp. TXMA1 TaxID=2876939 RepID=UPI001CCE4D6F|nr:hypothetical protein [Curtobacterium sp. TXMA1]UBQ04026.1 hypothetical protein LCG91_07740 [Curtobacterium sp. TXMA1]